jgi:N-terminal domain of anti-restriction factor ArdC/IrrE N-terminal-like domain
LQRARHLVFPDASRSNQRKEDTMTETHKTDILDRLTEGITQLTSSERWQDWLNMQSRFHRYSFNNTLLIMSQRPDATRVAGFNAWRKLDRFVRKGEKGIWILAPMVYKTDADEESSEDTTKRVLRGFKPVTVFDLSQTDGQELPEICTRLDGEDTGNVFAQLRDVALSLGFSVIDTDELADGVNGDCSHLEHRIRVRTSNSPAQRVKTLAHELGHAILHEQYDDRPLAELEAESVAFIVCANNGINSDDYSFGYVTGWAGGSNEARDAIKASGARIQQASDRILTAMSDEERAEVA